MKWSVRATGPGDANSLPFTESSNRQSSNSKPQEENERPGPRSPPIQAKGSRFRHQNRHGNRSCGHSLHVIHETAKSNERLSHKRSRVTSAQTRGTMLVRVGSDALLVFLDRCAKGTVGKVFLDADNVGSSFEL